jgi:hypothetical protein
MLKPDAGLTSEQARDVRARAWSYVFECFNRHTKKKAAPASGPDDAILRNTKGGNHVDQRPG